MQQNIPQGRDSNAGSCVDQAASDPWRICARKLIISSEKKTILYKSTIDATHEIILYRQHTPSSCLNQARPVNQGVAAINRSIPWPSNCHKRVIFLENSKLENIVEVDDASLRALVGAYVFQCFTADATHQDYLLGEACITCCIISGKNEWRHPQL